MAAPPPAPAGRGGGGRPPPPPPPPCPPPPGRGRGPPPPRVGRAEAEAGARLHLRLPDARTVEEGAVGGGDVLEAPAAILRIQAAVEGGDVPVLEDHFVAGIGADPHRLRQRQVAPGPREPEPLHRLGETWKLGGDSLRDCDRFGHPIGSRSSVHVQIAFRRAGPAISRIVDGRRCYDPRMPAVVLLLPKSGYRNEDFVAAAEKLGLSVIPASDVCHRLAETW